MKMTCRHFAVVLTLVCLSVAVANAETDKIVPNHKDQGVKTTDVSADVPVTGAASKFQFRTQKKPTSTPAKKPTPVSPEDKRDVYGLSIVNYPGSPTITVEVTFVSSVAKNKVQKAVLIAGERKGFEVLVQDEPPSFPVGRYRVGKVKATLGKQSLTLGPKFQTDTTTELLYLFVRAAPALELGYSPYGCNQIKLAPPAQCVPCDVANEGLECDITGDSYFYKTMTSCETGGESSRKKGYPGYCSNPTGKNTFCPIQSSGLFVGYYQVQCG